MTAFDEVSTALVARLEARRAEVEQAIFAHVRDAMPDQAGAQDAEYMMGLRSAITAIVEYGLMGIEHGDEWLGPVPAVAISQVQRAARVGTTLETVLRRYVAGYAILGDYVMDEADRGGFLEHGTALRRLQRKQASLLDGLIVAITDEYNGEVERARRSPEQRQTGLVLRVLAGEYVESSDLGYELDNAWHLGVIATGMRADEAVKRLAARLHRDILIVSRGEETVWAWFGGRSRLGASNIERLLSVTWPATVSLAAGEPGMGAEGMRLTHRQAQETLRVVLRRPQRLTLYRDVALLAAVLQNEVAVRSIVQIYLAPLGADAMLRLTLRAYLANGCSATDAAEVLGVVRGTVENRLRTVARALDRELHTCLRELQLALELEELGVSA